MTTAAPLLPPPITRWFAARGWSVRQHQLEMLEAARSGRHALLVAPTGAGKTLAGFLPTLAELARPEARRDGLHTLYVSPLKALAVDIARNLTAPIAEMGLDIRVETRTGDTPSARKSRQRQAPPDILLTTPESLSLLLSYPDSAQMLGGLQRVIFDEVHAFAPSKRGDLLALALARLQAVAPQLQRVALSATVADAQAYCAWLAPDADAASVQLVAGQPGAPPQVSILLPDGRIPWSGHAARHALPAVYELIARHRITLVFVNTRSIAERIFQDLWALNADNLPIGLHHGSLDVAQRRKVEAAMAAGQLRAVVATASLDLGLDWGDIDLVVQMGAPKGSARMLQRIGRANHRLDEPSRAVLVPGNRFEYLEAQAAVDAMTAGELDGEPFRPGALDVLAQHLVACACAGPLDEGAMLAEVRRAAPYAGLDDAAFADVLGFVSHGGYALRAYDRFQRLVRAADGRWRIAHPRITGQYRMNAGTIVEAPSMTVRLGNRRRLGQLEEGFATQLAPGDSFVFAGKILEFLRIEGTDLVVRPSKADRPSVPSYSGGRLPLTTHLARRVRTFLHDPHSWTRFPAPVREWLELQQRFSVLPDPDGLLVESFERQGRFYTVAYCFEGRNAHQTLGLLLTRRMEAAGLMPLGFVSNDYVLSIWSLRPVADPAPLFAVDIIDEEFKVWMEESTVLKKSFRDVSVISGLIERQHPGLKKTGRQVAFSADLIYDVLRKYDPAHLLLRATWADARGKITDLERLGDFLERVQGQITHKRLSQPSPLAVPVLLEIGRETVSGAADEALLELAEAELVQAATGQPPQP